MLDVATSARCSWRGRVSRAAPHVRIGRNAQRPRNGRCVSPARILPFVCVAQKVCVSIVNKECVAELPQRNALNSVLKEAGGAQCSASRQCRSFTHETIPALGKTLHLCRATMPLCSGCLPQEKKLYVGNYRRKMILNIFLQQLHCNFCLHCTIYDCVLVVSMECHLGHQADSTNCVGHSDFGQWSTGSVGTFRLKRVGSVFNRNCLAKTT